MDCRGFWTPARRAWLPESGVWARHIVTCHNRTVRSVELTKTWSMEARADPDDEVVSSQSPGPDARLAAAAIVGDLLERGHSRSGAERGDDGRRRGGEWEVVTFAASVVTARVRTQQEGNDYSLTVTAKAPSSVCE